ncbi:MAG: M24 family metallopeptidase [Candidatus Bipolaricaulia bacterium]
MNFHLRIDRLRAALEEEGIEGFAVINIEGSDSLNLRYLTGFTGTFGILIMTDSRYLERVKQETAGLEIVELKGNWAERLGEQLKSLELKRIGVNDLTISLHDAGQLREKAEVEPLPLEGPVERLRLRKDEGEIEKIKGAVALTDRAFAHALEFLHPGMSEREVAWELEKWLREHGSDGLAFPSIVAAGPNSALPHATPSDRPIAEGDLLLLDIGARYEGYCADMTRVVAIGRPAKRQMEIHEVVRRAQERALEGIKPGMTGVEADRLAREVIEEAGLAEHFGHGLGHGVGLAVHEGPRLSPFAEKKDLLEPGMVVTVEPGVYLVGEFGVRIEDLTVVREGGLEVLTNSAKELLSV